MLQIVYCFYYYLYCCTPTIWQLRNKVVSIAVLNINLETDSIVCNGCFFVTRTRCSSTQDLLRFDHSKTVISSRAFRHVAANSSNNLPSSILNCDSRCISKLKMQNPNLKCTFLNKLLLTLLASHVVVTAHMNSFVLHAPLYKLYLPTYLLPSLLH